MPKKECAGLVRRALKVKDLAFSLDGDLAGRLLQLLKDQATMVTPRDIVTESKDEPDNRFLECAEEADADYLVTGNKRHFPKSWKSTRIVNSREFIQVVQEQAALEN